jgi:multimeric flavodoxin WrbA
MKVTALVGSARKKGTYMATQLFMHNLESYGNIEYEIISLSDYRLEVCRGCKLCFEKGEEFCPLKDDRDRLIEKLNSSAGVVFASPNYSFNVSGQMKIFLDRLGYVFHRPCFFGKTSTSIVVQGIYGGNKISRYFNFIGKGLGFKVVKGCCLTFFEPPTAKDQRITEKILKKQSKKFYSSLIKSKFPVPTFFELMIFRMSRTSIRLMLDETQKDYTYYKKNGWFESGYYYPAQLNLFKKLAGQVFDFCFNLIFGKGKQIQPVQIEK